MCILYQTHSLPCDVRPFLALARATRGGKLPVTYVDPYSAPLSCSHRHNRLRFQTNPETACPYHGCCIRTVTSLPCDCADAAPWGGIAVGTEADEDIMQCAHFREYHEYICVDGTNGGLGDAQVDGEKWTELPALDSWVTAKQERREPDRQPNFFCEGPKWANGVKNMVQSGRRLWAEMSRAEARQRAIDEDGAGAVGEEELEAVRCAVEEAWEGVRKAQRVLREIHHHRAEEFLGFAQEMEGPGLGEVEMTGVAYPGMTSLI